MTMLTLSNDVVVALGITAAVVVAAGALVYAALMPVDKAAARRRVIRRLDRIKDSDVHVRR